jgi:hypothetical protein
MLRNILLTLGGTLIAGGLVVMLSGSFAAPLVAMVWGAVLVFGILYERYVYKTVVDKPPTGKYWVRTTERFVDDKTGRTLTVYYNTLSGERAYVAE